MRNIKLIIFISISLFACRSYKATKYSNESDLIIPKKQDTTNNERIKEIGKPICNSNKCDSVLICYKNINHIYLNDNNILPYYEMADCLFNELQINKDAHKWLVELYQSALIKQRKRADIDLRKLKFLRGEDAFITTLGWYKIQSIDPGYVAIDPAESFRFYVMEGMIKSIRGKSSTLLYNEAQLYFDDRKFYLIKDPLVYTKGVKDYWLDLYETAIKNKTIVYREYGDNVE